MNIKEFTAKHNLSGRNWTEEEVNLFNDFLYTCRLDDHANATPECFIVVAPETWDFEGTTYRIATPVEAMLRPDVANVTSCHSNLSSNGNARGGNLGYVSNPYWVTIYISTNTKKKASIAHSHSLDLAPYIDGLPNPVAAGNVMFTEDDNGKLVIFISRIYGDLSANTLNKLVRALTVKFPDAVFTMRPHEASLMRTNNFARCVSRPTVYGMETHNQLLKPTSMYARHIFFRYADIEQPMSHDPIMEALSAEQLGPVGVKVPAIACGAPITPPRIVGTITQQNPVKARRKKVECPQCKKLGEITHFTIRDFVENKGTKLTMCDACRDNTLTQIADIWFNKATLPTSKVYKVGEKYINFATKREVNSANLIQQEDGSYTEGKVYHFPLDVPKEDGTQYATEDFIVLVNTDYTIPDGDGKLHNPDGTDAFVHPQYRIVASGKWLHDNFPTSYIGHFDSKTDDGRWSAVDFQVKKAPIWFMKLLEHVAHNPTNTREEFIELGERYKAEFDVPESAVSTAPVKKPKRNKLKKEQALTLA